MLEGAYQTRPESAADNAEIPQLSDRHMRVSAPALGEHVMYWQLNSGPEQEVYRQRVLIFEAGDAPGTVKQFTWSLPEPERYIDAWRIPEQFTSLRREDLVGELPADCVQVWQPRDDGWYGRVDPDACRVWSERRQAWRGIEGEAMVTPAAYFTAERGFDADGKQVFGTAPGEYYVLDRR